MSNALAAIACCGGRSMEVDHMGEVLAHLPSIPGRLEPLPPSRDIHVFIDYAHTDDALKNVLMALREVIPGRLLLVFGCGGNRDKTKRPLMATIAEQLAYYTVLTSDNPRNEDPAQIAQEIAKGFDSSEKFEIELNREKAIEKGLALARSGDTVLIAGKGHENYQEFDHTVLPFDDKDVAQRWLAAHR